MEEQLIKFYGLDGEIYNSFTTRQKMEMIAAVLKPAANGKIPINYISILLYYIIFVILYIYSYTMSALTYCCITTFWVFFFFVVPPACSYAGKTSLPAELMSPPPPPMTPSGAINSMKRNRTAVNLLNSDGNLSALSETLYVNTANDCSNNEKCFKKNGYFSIDNKNAMPFKKDTASG